CRTSSPRFHGAACSGLWLRHALVRLSGLRPLRSALVQSQASPTLGALNEKGPHLREGPLFVRGSSARVVGRLHRGSTAPLAAACGCDMHSCASADCVRFAAHSCSRRRVLLSEPLTKKAPTCVRGLCSFGAPQREL